MTRSFATAVTLTLLAATCVAPAGSLPSVDDFESRREGSLDGQGPWAGAPSSRVLAQSATVAAGTQSAMISTNSILSQNFSDPSGTNVWIDFLTRAVSRPSVDAPALSADASAGFYFATNGHLLARSNAVWVTVTETPLTLGQWYRLTVHLDYPRQRWGLFVAGNGANEITTPLATNLAFNSWATNTYLRSFRVKN